MIVFRQQDFALAGYDANQVMELLLNSAQVVENVCMIKLKVIEDQRTRAVVYKLGALVEEGAVIFIRFNDKEWTFS